MTEKQTTEKRAHVIEALDRYWPGQGAAIAALAIPQTDVASLDVFPPRGKLIDVPYGDPLLVPVQENDNWEEIDWLGVAFWMLNGEAERSFERANGTVHSYAVRLKDWDRQFWDKAWVNRIALFLRAWAEAEGASFAPLPEPEIILTHDVDATTKTFVIRGKQLAFHFFNMLRGRGGLKKGLRFMFSPSDYWCFDTIRDMERAHGATSVFNFYGGLGQREGNIKQWIIDPGYDVFEPELKEAIRKMHAEGWIVGLHPSFLSWNRKEMLAAEKACLEKALGAPVYTCRQHWMMFSWADTWKSQQAAGFELDSSLGFNDRSAFRNSAALKFHPWDQDGPMNIQVLPIALMDSQFYDYAPMNDEERYTKMKRWIDEIKAVHGQATVIWHQRVFSSDYGWGDGYKTLLEIIDA